VSPQEKRFAVWGLGIGLASLIVGTLSYCGDVFDRSNSQAYQTSAPPTSLNSAEPELSNAVEANKLDGLIRSRIIGSTVTYWESITGPPISSWEAWREYEVNGCGLRISTSENSIDVVRMELSPACTFDWQQVIYNARGLPAAHQTTVGAFVDQQGNGDYLSDCIRSCGNAADPSLVMHWQGSRADDWIEVVLGVDANQDASLRALNVIQRHYVAALGEDAVVLDTSFNCDVNKAAVFGSALREVRISWVEFGRGMTPDNSSLPRTSCPN
jgi:hypothetical protein